MHKNISSFYKLAVIAVPDGTVIVVVFDETVWAFDGSGGGGRFFIVVEGVACGASDDSAAETEVVCVGGRTVM